MDWWVSLLMDTHTWFFHHHFSGGNFLVSVRLTLMGWLTFVSGMSTTQETVERPHDWWWHGGNALYSKGNWLVSRREKVELTMQMMILLERTRRVQVQCRWYHPWPESWRDPLLKSPSYLAQCLDFLVAALSTPALCLVQSSAFSATRLKKVKM